MVTVQQGWEIGLSSWIIQDGNYDNFETGQIAEFALEFYSKDYRVSDVRRKSCRKLDGAKYEVVGEVVYLTDKVWVLDFVISAFQDAKPPAGVSVGSFVAAEIDLGIDPFFYFEGLHKLSNIPPLIYTWKIDSIDQQTAPFIETTEPSGRKLLVRDEKRRGYRRILKTDAWKDDRGNAEYLLNSTLLAVPPKFKLAAAS